MPYMLSALSDPLEDIQLEGLQAVEQLGEQYEQEHEEDLLDQKRFSHLLPSNICQDTRAPILPPPFQRNLKDVLPKQTLMNVYVIIKIMFKV